MESDRRLNGSMVLGDLQERMGQMEVGLRGTRAFLVVLYVLVAVLAGVVSARAQSLVLTDMDADPFGTGTQAGALFHVELGTGTVVPLATDPQWIDPLDIVQGGGSVWWIVDISSAEIRQWVISGLGVVSTTQVYGPASGLVAPVRWHATSTGVPLVVDGGAATLWRALPPPGLVPYLTAPELVAPVSLGEDVAGGLFVLDADARPISWPPVGSWIPEGALFRASDMAVAVASASTISPMDFVLMPDGKVVILDANAGVLVGGLPTGTVFVGDLADPWPVPLVEVVSGLSDPLDLLYESPDTVLVVDMNSDPGYGFDGLGRGYMTFGRGGVYRLHLSTGELSLVARDPRWVNPARIDWLR